MLFNYSKSQITHLGLVKEPLPNGMAILPTSLGQDEFFISWGDSIEIPYGYCHCGCGRLTSIALRTNSKWGWIKGEPIRFLHGHQSRKFPINHIQKLCPDCGFQRSLDDFYDIKSPKWNGKSRYCKEHQKKRNSEWNLKHHDHYKNRLKLYYKNNKPKIILMNNAWREQHSAKMKTYKILWDLENGEANRKSKRAWAKRNSEYIRVKGAIAAGIRRKAEGNFSLLDIKRIYEDQKGCCKYCFKDLLGKFEIDHKIPTCKGGSNWPINIALTCSKCNQSKGKKTPEEYVGWKQKRFMRRA